MSSQQRIKDPESIEWFGIDWARWLESDTIASSSWMVPSGLTLTAQENTTTVAKVKLGGGIVGTTYQVVNHIVTVGGEENDCSLYIVCREK